MKKFLKKVTTLLIACVMFLGAFSGCALVSTNMDRDMAQVLTEIKVSDSAYVKDYEVIDKATTIYKRDLVALYNSYGAMYMYYYGMSAEDVIDQLCDSLIKTEIVTQRAKMDLAKYYNEKFPTNPEDYSDFDKDFAEISGIKQATPSLKAKDDIDSFLTEYEIAYAKYQIKESLQNLINQYKEDSDEDEEVKDYDTLTVTPRTVPTKTEEDRDSLSENKMKETVPTDDEYRIANKVLEEDEWETLKTTYENLYDLNLAVYNSYSVKVEDSKDRRALSKAVNDFVASGMMSSKEKKSYDRDSNADVVQRLLDNCDYFANTYKTQKGNLLITKYENYLRDEIEKQLDANSDSLWNEYVNLYNSQKGLYEASISDYESTLDKVSDDTFLVYNEVAGGYGYVSHILLPFSTEQKAIISDAQSKDGVSSGYVKDVTTSLYSCITVADQRATWVQNNYGTYDYSSKTFTFDKKYLCLDPESDYAQKAAYQDLIKYNGIVISDSYSAHTAKDENDLDKDVWLFDHVLPDNMTFSSFYNKYLNGILGMEEYYYKLDETGIISSAVVNGEIDKDFYDAFRDIMFAFSDSNAGGFDTQYGFVYSPYTSSTTYVKEFAKAASELVEKGVASYTIVPTEYGYHIMICTGKIDVLSGKGATYASNKVDFDNDLSDKDSLAYKYRTAKLEAYTSKEVSTRSSNFIKKYYDQVSVNSKVYADMLG